MRKTVKNKKTVGFSEVFLSENDFQTSSTVNFQKKFQNLEAWKPSKDMKIRLQFFFTYSSTYELNITQKSFWAFNKNIFKVLHVLREK